MNKAILLSAAATALCLLSSCAIAPPPPPPVPVLPPPPPPVPVVGEQQTPQQPETYSPVRVTPLSGVTFTGSGPQAAATSHLPPDTYTRLVIVAQDGSVSDETNTPPTALNPEVYPYKKRSGIARFFVGKHHSETLSVKVESGDFVATVPLLSLSHDSTKAGGEQFNRTIYHVAQKYPLFLVRGTGAGDIARATITVSGSDTTESSAATTALSAVMTATGLLASPPALLTKLSAQSNRAVATSIDSAINGLMATKLDEVQVVDGPVRDWLPVTIDLRLPRKEGKWNAHSLARKAQEQGNGGADQLRLNDLDYMPVGKWTIAFSAPRVSAFSVQSVTCPAADCAASLQAAQNKAKNEITQQLGDVLHFPVIANGDQPVTLGAYLRQLKWWTAQVGNLKAGATGAAAADQFCRNVRSALSEIGFNTFDGYMALAALKASDDLTKDQIALLSNSNCQWPGPPQS